MFFSNAYNVFSVFEHVNLGSCLVLDLCYLKYMLFALQDILQTDSSLKRSDEEVALLDTYATIKSPLVSIIILTSAAFKKGLLW